MAFFVSPKPGLLAYNGADRGVCFTVGKGEIRMPHGRRAGHKPVQSEVLRYLLMGVGWAAVMGGILGIFLPLLPSVPFLLLALFCFSRSSERFHTWLVEHKHLGPMLKDYLLHGGIPLKVKAVAIGMIWISFPVSTFLLVEAFWVRVALLSTAAAVTVYLLTIPTAAPAADGADGNRKG